jgi:hypothetical protein
MRSPRPDQTRQDHPITLTRCKVAVRLRLQSRKSWSTMTPSPSGTRSRPKHQHRPPAARRYRQTPNSGAALKVTFCVRGVISPLLANIYLYYCFDLWAARWRRREATGDMIAVRYADDLVAGFEHEDDARRFLDAMRTRFEAFALALHPEKTRLIKFGCQAAVNRDKRGLGKPETFNFLGFPFICGKSRGGRFLVHRKTRRDRMQAKLKESRSNCGDAGTSRSLNRGNG